MDRYHAHRICTGISITESFETDCGIAAATCLILSSKLHEIRPLSGIQQVQSLFLMVVTSYLIFPLFLYFFCVDCSQQPVFLTMKHNWFNLNVICFIFYALTLYHKLHLLCWYVKWFLCGWILCHWVWLLPMRSLLWRIHWLVNFGKTRLIVYDLLRPRLPYLPCY